MLVVTCKSRKKWVVVKYPPNLDCVTSAVVGKMFSRILTGSLLGLQSVGVPMLGTLVAELIILEIGRAMDVPTIKQFCLFAQAALIVEYLLDMTFFIAILAIDVNRAEVKPCHLFKGTLCNLSSFN